MKHEAQGSRPGHTVRRRVRAMSLAVAAGAIVIAIASGAPTFSQTSQASSARAASSHANKSRLDVAKLDANGKLVRPVDLDEWVFLGTSLGMGYNEMEHSAGNPGQFQVVLMERAAYRYFLEHGRYAPGSMFLLSFYESTQRRSINQAGYVQSDLASYEIHVIDPDRSPDGRVFYLFRPGDAAGAPMPKGNDCVRCHTAHGAFDGTFAQFYPTIRDRIPKEALEKALADHDIR